jgi:hypothetical protein
VRALAVAVLAAGLLAAGAHAAEVVVLKGGARIELKAPWTQQGNNAILTRADGTVLSVPLSDIDRSATAAARKAAGASPDSVAPAQKPAQTPAEALRASRAVQKAKVRLTDADVSHEAVQTAEAGSGEKKDSPKGAARLDVVGYDQSKAGGSLLVRGSVRNFGGTTANNSRMAISAMDLDGGLIATGEASLAKGNLETYETVAFTASIPIGDKVVGSLRFQPQWIAAPPPAPAAEAAAAKQAGSAPAAPGAPAALASQPPAPQPTPYGQGMLYAAPSAPAAASPPADGKTGYLPGASDSASQPKPPQ